MQILRAELREADRALEVRLVREVLRLREARPAQGNDPIVNWGGFYAGIQGPDKCLKCGHHGREVFNRFDCSNASCPNFPRPRARDPEPEPEREEPMDEIELPPEGPVSALRQICRVNVRDVNDVSKWLESPEAVEAIRRVIEKNRRKT